MIKKETTFSLKDQLFNKESVNYLADLFVFAYSTFDKKWFVKNVLLKFPELGLKERITHMAEQLHVYLPKGYEDAIHIIIQALPPELDPTKNDDDFGDFILSPLGEYVALYWCTEEHFAISRHALKECTKRFSVEFPIRKFINTFPERMHKELLFLAASDNYHQRRLVSEWSRITLPWGMNIIRTLEQVIPFLDLLYADRTRYVTRSVANNMNGLSKINPGIVFETLIRWKKSWKQSEKEMQFIIKHSLRTLLKQWNTQAMEMLWYASPDHITLAEYSVTPSVIIGETLPFQIMVKSDWPLWKCRVEYAVWFMKSNGKISEKVFKISEWDRSESRVTFEKKHTFKMITTRAYYPWKHTITPIINWKRYETKEFILYTSR